MNGIKERENDKRKEKELNVNNEGTDERRKDNIFYLKII